MSINNTKHAKSQVKLQSEGHPENPWHKVYTVIKEIAKSLWVSCRDSSKSSCIKWMTM